MASSLRACFRLMLLCALLLPGLQLQAQSRSNAVADSLKRLLPKTSSDTARARVLLALSKTLSGTAPEEALVFADSGLSLVREKGPDELHGKLCITLGILYNGKGMYQLALKYFLESEPLFERLGDKKQQVSLQNLLGNTYFGNRDLDKALEAYRVSGRLAKEMGDTLKLAIAQVGEANTLAEKGQRREAIGIMKRAYAVFRHSGDSSTVSRLQGNIGNMYIGLNEFDKAKPWLDSAMAIAEKLDDPYVHYCMLQLYGNISIHEGDYNKALQQLQEAAAECIKVDATDDLKDIYELISDTYDSLGDFKKALDYHKLYSIYKDSVFNTERSRQLLETQEAFGAEKKQRQIDAQRRALEDQAFRQKLLIIGILILLIVAFLVYSRYRVKKRSHELLEQKNHEIATKNKEITDSINYAKRIQESFLPPEPFFKSLLPDSFLLYRPKDIVSGDFYWLNRVGDRTIVAAGDCTGHGVPGAFLSAICNDLMNQVIRDLGIVNPAEILNQLDRKLRQLQGKDTGGMHDGMDVAIVAIERNTLHYAGARRPLVLVRDGQLTEIKGSKFSVGEIVDEKQFTEHRIEIRPGDMLYLFTDGLADQFGGPKGKKFKYQRLLDLLCANATHPPATQRDIVEREFSEWKGALEQVDDVCLIGIRIDENMF